MGGMYLEKDFSPHFRWAPLTKYPELSPRLQPVTSGLFACASAQARAALTPRPGARQKEFHPMVPI